MNNIANQLLIFGEAPKADMFGSLGIDWKLLLLQSLAFLILLFILRKFVYPPLASMLDKREEAIKASADAAMEAERHAAETEARTSELLEEAKSEAAAIMAAAREEAVNMAEASQKKAESKAAAIVEAAREELAREVEGAKKALQSETIELVAMATGKIVEEKVDAKKDAALIEKALKGAKR